MPSFFACMTIYVSPFASMLSRYVIVLLDENASSLICLVSPSESVTFIVVMAKPAVLSNTSLTPALESGELNTKLPVRLPTFAISFFIACAIGSGSRSLFNGKNRNFSQLILFIFFKTSSILSLRGISTIFTMAKGSFSSFVLPRFCVCVFTQNIANGFLKATNIGTARFILHKYHSMVFQKNDKA